MSLKTLKMDDIFERSNKDIDGTESEDEYPITESENEESDEDSDTDSSDEDSNDDRDDGSDNMEDGLSKYIESESTNGEDETEEDYPSVGGKSIKPYKNVFNRSTSGKSEKKKSRKVKQNVGVSKRANKKRKKSPNNILELTGDPNIELKKRKKNAKSSKSNGNSNSKTDKLVKSAGSKSSGDKKSEALDKSSSPSVSRFGKKFCGFIMSKKGSIEDYYGFKIIQIGDKCKNPIKDHDILNHKNKSILYFVIMDIFIICFLNKSKTRLYIPSTNSIFYHKLMDTDDNRYISIEDVKKNIDSSGGFKNMKILQDKRFKQGIKFNDHINAKEQDEFIELICKNRKLIKDQKSWKTLLLSRFEKYIKLRSNLNNPLDEEGNSNQLGCKEFVFERPSNIKSSIAKKKHSESQVSTEILDDNPSKKVIIPESNERPREKDLINKSNARVSNSIENKQISDNRPIDDNNDAPVKNLSNQVGDDESKRKEFLMKFTNLLGGKGKNDLFASREIEVKNDSTNLLTMRIKIDRPFLNNYDDLREKKTELEWLLLKYKDTDTPFGKTVSGFDFFSKLSQFKYNNDQ